MKDQINEMSIKEILPTVVRSYCNNILLFFMSEWWCHYFPLLCLLWHNGSNCSGIFSSNKLPEPYFLNCSFD